MSDNNLSASQQNKKDLESITSSILCTQLLSQVDEGIIVYDKELQYQLWNSVMERITGYKADEVLGKKAMEIFPDLKKQGLEEILIRTFTGEKIVSENIKFINKNTGEVMWNTSTYSPLKNKDGRVIGVIITVKNVNEIKHAEEELKISQSLYKDLVETSQDMIWQCDKEGTFTFLNPAWETTFGYKLSEMLGRKFFEFQPPEYAKRDAKEYEKILKRQKSLKGYETIHLSKDGNLIYTVVNAVSVYDINGNVIGARGTSYDITKTKIAEEKLRANSEMLNQILNTVPQSIFWKDINSVYLGCNNVFAKDTAISSSEEIIGKTDYDLPWPPKEADAYRKDDSEVMLNKRIKRHIIEPLQQADGTRIWIDTTKIPLMDKNGQVYGILGVYEDITNRKEVEEKLQQSEEKFKVFMESLPAAAFLKDEEGRVLFANKFLKNLFSWGDAEGRLTSDLLPPEMAKKMSDDDMTALKTGTMKFIDHFYDLEGNERYFDTRKFPIPVREGKKWVGGMAIDITQRIKAEQALKISEDKYRTLFETMAQGVVYQNSEGKIISINPAAERILGYRFEDMQNKTSEDNIWNIIHEDGSLFPGDKHPAMLSLKTGKEQKNVIMGVYNSTKKEYVWITVNTVPLFKEGEEKPYQVYATFTDITELKKAEETIKNSEEKLRTIISNFPIIIFSVDKFGLFTLSEGKGLELLNLKPGEVVGKSVFETYKDIPEICNDVRKALSGEFRINTIYVNNYIFSIWYNPVINAKGEVTGLIGAAMDITERKHAEEARLEIERKMLHTQKLESLGVLAGGIAHDFNNLLMAILGNLELALEDLSPVSLARPNLEEAVSASKKAADLTKQMLAYSGKGRFVLKNINISELINENIHILKAAVSKNVTFNFQIKDDIPLIMADAGQIQQILINLITNASEAIGEKAGIVTLSTGSAKCDEKHLKNSRLEEKPAPGDFVWLEVSDTGSGMSLETQQRIFDPFYTTKFTGRGLGMSAVLGILRGHKGALMLNTEMDKGSTIRVLFPASSESAVSAGSSQNNNRQDDHIQAKVKNKGTILLVDDENIVRSLSEKMIKHSGYDFISAVDGQMAVDIYKEHIDKISCVLLDLKMPRMDGVKTFEVLKLINPDVKVILCSGYSEQEATLMFQDKGLCGFIQKPYTAAQLGKLLDTLIHPDK